MLCVILLLDVAGARFRSFRIRELHLEHLQGGSADIRAKESIDTCHHKNISYYTTKTELAGLNIKSVRGICTPRLNAVLMVHITPRR